MPKYNVYVCRTAYCHANVKVTADNKAEAESKALAVAGDHSFNLESSSEYTVDDVMLVE